MTVTLTVTESLAGSLKVFLDVSLIEAMCRNKTGFIVKFPPGFPVERIGFVSLTARILPVALAADDEQTTLPLLLLDNTRLPVRLELSREIVG